ncbi:alpha/beta fold hydrolase [Streptomyces sp. NPDC048111]|uniref:alpha/beta fold hydrolase n=1 Tax=Streptomyces sp. NPDC048111 TaxID=3365500 RepID=UPI00372134EB
MARGPGEAPGGSPLWIRHQPRHARAAVITLRGGRASGYEAARPWQLAALRMRPVLRAAASAVRRDETVLGDVRYRYRGWNQEDPVQDTVRALDELRELAGSVPVVLVGHSMGGRAALRAAVHPNVSGVVALAPWLPPGEPVEQLGGKRAVLLHGDRDTVTSAEASTAHGRRARAAGARAAVVVIRGGDHAMVRRSGVWHRTITEVVADMLGPLDGRPSDLATALRAADSPVFL